MTLRSCFCHRYKLVLKSMRNETKPVNYNFCHPKVGLSSPNTMKAFHLLKYLVLLKKDNAEGLCHESVAGEYRLVHFLILALDRAV